jgi:SHS2 domain-containing protein
MNLEAGYRLIEHTADAGVAAWGPSPEQAFTHATRGMYTVMLGSEPAEWQTVGPNETLNIHVRGQDWQDLLVNWLAEFVYHFDVDGFVPQQINFKQCQPPICEAIVKGVRLDDPEQAGGVGIKAVTYHQLEVNITPGRTEINVIFDI